MGVQLTPTEARGLASDPLPQVLAAARERRARASGLVVTYSPKVFIPLTQLCRDVCHYCTFAAAPRRGQRAYMDREAILSIARAGAESGCHEALFTLGDKPELRYKVAREELAELGCASTVEYLARMAELVLEETGLLPHANAGALTAEELALLRRVCPSQGIMLESSAARLAWRGGPHFGSPDKRPTVRLATIDAAGELAIPLTTGILVGIGETRAERIDALLAIRSLHARHGHIQEVLVQNFRAKSSTKMAGFPEPSLDELLWTAAVARLVLPPGVSIQVPPNLSYDEFPRLLDAGIDDWGGISPVTIDHVNPEAGWPHVDRLREATRAAGLELVPRLTVHPRYARDPERWLDKRLVPQVLRLTDADGLARSDGWIAGHSASPPAADGSPAPAATRRDATSPVRSALDSVRRGDQLGEEELCALFGARGSDLAAVVGAADRLRREVCGEEVTYVVTRNINYTNVCYFRCGFCAFSKGKLARNLRGQPYVVPVEEIVRRSREAWERGAVELCLQGGIHPGFTGDFYLEVLEAVKSELPELHLHAFSALEVWQGAQTLNLSLEEYQRRLLSAGLSSLPGTAAEILDDEVRRVLCPDKIPTDVWLRVHDSAHRLGLKSTTTVMFGHIDGPRNWARHLIALREQQKLTGGFTEFVPLPFVHMEAPLYLRGQARRGPTFREAILMHAVGRLALHPWITNVQASWTKLGVEGAQVALRSGANDFGGTLMNESISRAAGARHGQEMPPERIEAAVRSIGRRPRQRTTLYATPDPERVRLSHGAPPLREPVQLRAEEAGLRRPAKLLRSAVPAGG
ncbi:MAG: 5-amino-6-(D-ribitylamino)uracil--L-tyrosine 4-hydroxyphenyl transferase CofH [Thermoleophilaceae bacterium]